MQSQRARSWQSQESRTAIPTSTLFLSKWTPAEAKDAPARLLDPRAVWSGCFPLTPALTQQTEAVFYRLLRSIISRDIKGLNLNRDIAQIPRWKLKTDCKRSNVSSVPELLIWGNDGRNTDLHPLGLKPLVTHPPFFSKKNRLKA